MHMWHFHAHEEFDYKAFLRLQPYWSKGKRQYGVLHTSVNFSVSVAWLLEA